MSKKKKGKYYSSLRTYKRIVEVGKDLPRRGYELIRERGGLERYVEKKHAQIRHLGGKVYSITPEPKGEREVYSLHGSVPLHWKAGDITQLEKDAIKEYNKWKKGLKSDVKYGKFRREKKGSKSTKLRVKYKKKGIIEYEAIFKNGLLQTVYVPEKKLSHKLKKSIKRVKKKHRELRESKVKELKEKKRRKKLEHLLVVLVIIPISIPVYDRWS